MAENNQNSINNRLAEAVWVIMAYDGLTHTLDRVGVSNNKAEAMAYAKRCAVGSVTTFIMEGYSQ
jgi:hypothetical protein